MKKTDSKKKLKIALLGTRGVPANYGGFETCVEEIGKRLVDKGHEVVVYCRSNGCGERSADYLGMNLVYLPSVKRKSFETMSHTILSVFHSLISCHDVYMVFNVANSLFVLPLKILGKKIIINTDGLEWKRSKWGKIGKIFFKISEILGCLFSNRLVSDSKWIRKYYVKKHKTDSTEIAYGAYILKNNKNNNKRLLEMGLVPQGYFLQITRFEPENNPLLTIRAFKKINTSKKMVLVGWAAYPSDYLNKIKAEINDSIILTGCIYDMKQLEALWCSCYAYIHGNTVGGTNPSLLQAMGAGCFTIAMDNCFNRYVLRDCGIYYSDLESLTEQMQWALYNSKRLGGFQKRAQTRIRVHYSWEKVTDEYENLFQDVVKGNYPVFKRNEF